MQTRSNTLQQWSRRALLGTVLGVCASHFTHASTGERVAVIDWAMLETLLAIGIVPVAATELVQFRKVAVEPEAPEGVADLGLRGTPNFEMLRLCDPGLIVISPWYARHDSVLTKIAPVLSYAVFEPGKPPYGLAEQAMKALGERLGKISQASRYMLETSKQIEQAKAQVAPFSKRPVFLINLGDARHFRVFGADSMFGDVLQRLGLTNAWTKPTSYAASAPIPLEALADVPEARIVIIGPTPPDSQSTLAQSPLWQALPAVRERKVVSLAPINPFGALPSARRFARLLTEGLMASEGAGRG